MSPGGRRRRIVVVVLVAVTLAAIAVGWRVREVHDYGWEWTPFPSAAPPKIRFEGRDYSRGDVVPTGLPAGYVRKGRTLGNGQIYEDAGVSGTSTVVYVQDGTRVYDYALMGGP